MSRSERGRVLAIGIDAAEPALVRRLVDRGEMPHLRALLDRGVWGCVRSPAGLGSGAVWPTFLTGSPPSEHGVYGEWSWNPAAMGVSRTTRDHLTPFWAAMAQQGRSVAVLDVPFAPIVGLPGCVEVADWGAHDPLTGRLAVSPAALRRVVTDSGGVHPFASEIVDASGPDDHDGLTRVVSRCVAGVRQRGRLAVRMMSETSPDLFLVVFTEVHRASHLSWHTADVTHPIREREDPACSVATAGGPPEILMEVDRQLGRLVAAAGPDATVLVFGLHGMRATRGIPAILTPLLGGLGLSAAKGWRAQSWAERADRSLRALKRRLPPPLKRLYYRSLSRAVTARLAEPSMPMPPYDWSRTVAVSLPTDQHGWIRLNVAGREARGIVEPGEYEATCDRIEQLLRGITTQAGLPIVQDVVRTGASADAASTLPLPDLVVHWAAATLVEEIRVRAPRVSARSVGLKFTGQHAPDGFFVLRPGRGDRPIPTEAVSAEALHRTL